MIKELLILRHAEAGWNSNITDYNRPLTKQGQDDAQQIGLWLKNQNLTPELVISSPAIRAISTAEIVCDAMEFPIHSVQIEKNIYEASLSALHQVLFTIPGSVQRLLLIGHNPGLEYLLSDLAPDNPRTTLYPATVAYLQLDQQWSSLQGKYFIQRPNSF